MYSGKYSFTNICVYYLNYKGKVINYLITLLKQLSCYTGINYTKIVSSVFTHFSVSKERFGCFITNNITNNSICLNHLSLKFGFKKKTYWI